MKNLVQILEAKGYDNSEISDIIQANDDNLDMKVREEFGVQDEALHLWEAYYKGDANEDNLLKAAVDNGFDDIEDLLSAMDNRLLELCKDLKYANPEAYLRAEFNGRDFRKCYDDNEIDLVEFCENSEAGTCISIENVTYYKVRVDFDEVENNLDQEYLTIYFNEEGELEIL
jgi:hypothetical protein